MHDIIVDYLNDLAVKTIDNVPTQDMPQDMRLDMLMNVLSGIQECASAIERLMAEHYKTLVVPSTN